MLKIKNIASFSFLLGSLLISSQVLAQNDFSVTWNEHMTGDTVEENPFGGSFTIKNVGENVIPANDTIWYGYIIEDEVYDLGPEIDHVSGEVLSSDFSPGEEISIVNNFDWPLFWDSGSTIEICATVFGIGVVSYEDVLFTGDDDPTNNTDCIFAILPEFSVGLVEEGTSAVNKLTVFSVQEGLMIKNNDQNNIDNVSLNIFSLSGTLVHQSTINTVPGQNIQQISELTKGAYLINLTWKDNTVNHKVIIH